VDVAGHLQRIETELIQRDLWPFLRDVYIIWLAAWIWWRCSAICSPGRMRCLPVQRSESDEPG